MANDYKLSVEHQQTLRAMQPDLAAAERVLDGLEASGIDVSEQRDRLNKAKLARDGMLRAFGRPMTPQ